MTTVEIYTKSWCAYCRLAKAVLEEQNIDFTEIDVTFDREKETEMRNRSGNRTVPQVFINNESIGGYTELARMSAQLDLYELVNRVDDQETRR